MDYFFRLVCLSSQFRSKDYQLAIMQILMLQYDRGEIVRSAVTLSSITKKPILIENIRKKRKIPGLRPQHLTAIKLLAKICNANVDGLNVGSTAIKFIPKNVESKTIDENIGTAGSISLILQVLIPAISISKKSLKLSIIGGTD